MAHGLSEGDVEGLAASAHGFVGADLALLVQEAALCALRRIVAAKKGCGKAALAAAPTAGHDAAAQTVRIKQRLLAHGSSARPFRACNTSAVGTLQGCVGHYYY